MTGEAKADWGRSFWRAVSHGDVDQVRECLAVGVDPDLAASGHYRPLMAAAARADLEVVRLLLGAGADVHGHARCATPLLSAAQAGSEEIYRPGPPQRSAATSAMSASMDSTSPARPCYTWPRERSRCAFAALYSTEALRPMPVIVGATHRSTRRVTTGHQTRRLRSRRCVYCMRGVRTQTPPTSGASARCTSPYARAACRRLASC
jgi:hypothetical protein